MDFPLPGLFSGMYPQENGTKKNQWKSHWSLWVSALDLTCRQIQAGPQQCSGERGWRLTPKKFWKSCQESPRVIMLITRPFAKNNLGETNFSLFGPTQTMHYSKKEIPQNYHTVAWFDPWYFNEPWLRMWSYFCDGIHGTVEHQPNLGKYTMHGRYGM